MPTRRQPICTLLALRRRAASGTMRGVDELTAAVSSALREHDPLDPWLTETHWDEHYWDQEAQAIADRLTADMDPAAVRAIVMDVLGELLGTSADGKAGFQEQSRRLDCIAVAISAALR
jgi:hypothetical protein